jgi:hypothetical protein
MRTFLREHWKALVAIVALMALALLSVRPGPVVPEPSLAARLHRHVAAIAPARPDNAARYIAEVLKAEGYVVRRQASRAGGQAAGSIEVSLARLAPHARPTRTFIVGARYDAVPGANENGSAAAAVLELARLLKNMRPSQGTEVKFVFFADETPPRSGRPGSGSFIAFVGTLASSRLVQDALSAFRPVSDFPAHGLAAPAYMRGLTLSGNPAIMITDTGFMRYPYYKTTDKDAQDQFDYDGSARVVQGLARTIVALAAGAQG